MEGLEQAVKNNLKWISVDQASVKTGIAYWQGSSLQKTELYKASNKDFYKRLVQIREKVVSLIMEEGVESALIEGIQLEDIEDQSKDISVDTFRKLAIVQGIYIEVFERFEIPYSIIPPTVWKSSLGILKNDGLEKVKRQEQKRRTIQIIGQYYTQPISEDEADAVGIGLYQIQKTPLW